MTNLFRIQINSVWPPVSKVEVLSHNPEDVWRVEVNQTLPPIYRVNINLNILDLIEKLESIISTDSRIGLHISKPFFSETGFPSDTIDVVPTLNKKEIQAVSDQVNSIDVDKALYDIQRIREKIVFDISRITDNTSLVESLILLHAIKPFLENISTSDEFSRIVDYNRIKQEIVNTKQQILFQIIKAIFDNASISDHITAIDLDKLLSDINSIDDEFSRIVDYNRIKQEIINTKQQILLQIIKAISDNTNLSDIAAIEFNKLFSDINSIDDEFSRIVDYNRELTNLASIEHLLQLNLSKLFDDNSEITSVQLINSSKAITNQTSISDDGSVFNQSYVNDIEPYFAEKYVGQQEFF